MDGDKPQDPVPDPGENPKDDRPTPPASGDAQRDAGLERQELRHSPVSARVVDRIARGVLSNGIAVLDSPTEFVIDFFQGLSRPPLIVARVVLAPRTMGSFLVALRDNLDRFTRTFGPPTPLPPPPPSRPTIQEIYENYRLPEELLSGSYANSVMITHSPSEFDFDFITGFYPTAAVSARVFMSAPHIPRVVAAMTNAMKQFEQRYRPHAAGSGAGEQPTPDRPAGPSEPSSG